jgi:cap1 methyltransferase
MTLQCAADSTLNWYPDLVETHRFVPTFGRDGTGDIFNPSNLDSLGSLVAEEDVQLVVGDGGFDVPVDRANFQESITRRIVFAQWFAALTMVKREGCVVLKLFDTFSPLTRSILFLSAFWFRRVMVIKPKHSRIVNSERYLVGMGFLANIHPAWGAFLRRVYEEGFTDECGIYTLVSAEEMSSDTFFCEGYQRMTETIAEKQMAALGMVMRHLKSQTEVGVARAPESTPTPAESA